MSTVAEAAQEAWQRLQRSFPAHRTDRTLADAYQSGLADAWRDLCACVAIAEAVRWAWGTEFWAMDTRTAVKIPGPTGAAPRVPWPLETSGIGPPPMWSGDPAQMPDGWPGPPWKP